MTTLPGDGPFKVAVKIVNELPEDGPVQPTTDDQLEFYAYFKTVTVGKSTDAPTPGMFDFKGKAKLAAWKKVEDTPKAEAEKLYVAKLIEMLKRDTSNEGKPSDESTGYLKQIQDAIDASGLTGYPATVHSTAVHTS